MQTNPVALHYWNTVKKLYISEHTFQLLYLSVYHVIQRAEILHANTRISPPNERRLTTALLWSTSVYLLPQKIDLSVPYIKLRTGEKEPVPMAAQSKAWVCGYSPAGIAGSNLPRYMDISCKCHVLSGRCFSSGWSLIRRSRTGCVVSDCDLKALILRRPSTTRVYCTMERNLWKRFCIQHWLSSFSHFFFQKNGASGKIVKRRAWNYGVRHYIRRA